MESALRVLHLADDRKDAEVVRDVLEAGGLACAITRVQTRADFVAALAAFQAEPGHYDLVLTDETMPEITGTDLAREIRRMRADVPIVMMSGHSGPQLTEPAYGLLRPQTRRSP